MLGLIGMTTEERNAGMVERDRVLTEAHQNYAKGMNFYSLGKVHNRTISQELVQDTFIKTWSYLVRKGKIDLMKSFLYHVLNQLIIDEYRKRKTSSLEVLLEKGFELSFDYSERTVDILDGKAALLLIQYLPAKYEKIIRMRYEQELSIKEISLITGQSRNAVAVQAHRGLAKLRKIYNRA